jgi:hypothetical protein
VREPLFFGTSAVQQKGVKTKKDPKAAFLVVCNPSMNKL